MHPETSIYVQGFMLKNLRRIHLKTNIKNALSDLRHKKVISYLVVKPLLAKHVSFPRDTRLSLGQRLMLLRVNPLILDAYFLVQSFYVTELRSRLLSQGRGVTAKHLNVGDVKRLEIPIPSFDEQQEISKVLIAFNAKIAALEKETALLDELFHAMLEELMTGERSAVPLIDAELPN